MQRTLSTLLSCGIASGVVLSAGCAGPIDPARPSAGLTEAPAGVPAPDRFEHAAQADLPCADGTCQSYSVVLVEPGQAPPVRQSAGDQAPLIDALDADENQVPATGRWAMVDGHEWLEVVTPKHVVGWADARFLTQTVAPAAFCQDTAAVDLLIDLQVAFDTEDGERLFADVSPLHGLTIDYDGADGQSVHVSDVESRQLFDSDVTRTWGIASGSGLPISGTFRDVVLPELQSLLAHPAGEPSCNALPSGHATAPVAVPERFAAVNFYAIEEPAPPGSLSGVTWVVGIEYLENQPYLMYLHRIDGGI